MVEADIGIAKNDAGRPATVEVLLATCNGERFLREQVESILSQEYAAVRVLARDDGSRDGTVGILAEYAAKLPERFRIVAGAPTGSAKKNFLELMKAATAEYVCFADQDDVWLSRKIRRGMEAMAALEARHGAQTPLLVFSDLRVVDDQLQTIHASMWQYAEIGPESVHRLARLLGQSVVTGCTITINRAMLRLARRMPDEAEMHDRWIALLAAAMGQAAIVREPLVLYRQHSSNVIGATAPDGSVSGTVERAKQSEGRRAERWRCERMAEALLKLHGSEMPERQANVLRAYLRSGRSESALERVATTVRYGFFRAGLLRNLALIADLARAKTDRGPA